MKKLGYGSENFVLYLCQRTLDPFMLLGVSTLYHYSIKCALCVHANNLVDLVLKN